MCDCPFTFLFLRGRKEKDDSHIATFIYDGSIAGKTVWERMAPVGLMSGDDELVTDLLNKPGAFINPSLKETQLNKDLIVAPAMQNGNKAFMSHHGLGVG